MLYVVAVLGDKFIDIARAKHPCGWDLPAYGDFIFYCLMSSRNRKGLDKFRVSGRESIVGKFAQKSPEDSWMDANLQQVAKPTAASIMFLWL